MTATAARLPAAVCRCAPACFPSARAPCAAELKQARRMAWRAPRTARAPWTARARGPRPGAGRPPARPRPPPSARPPPPTVPAPPRSCRYAGSAGQGRVRRTRTRRGPRQARAPFTPRGCWSSVSKGSEHIQMMQPSGSCCTRRAASRPSLGGHGPARAHQPTAARNCARRPCRRTTSAAAAARRCVAAARSAPRLAASASSRPCQTLLG